MCDENTSRAEGVCLHPLKHGHCFQTPPFLIKIKKTRGARLLQHTHWHKKKLWQTTPCELRLFFLFRQRLRRQRLVTPETTWTTQQRAWLKMTTSVPISLQFPLRWEDHNQRYLLGERSSTQEHVTLMAYAVTTEKSFAEKGRTSKRKVQAPVNNP